MALTIVAAGALAAGCRSGRLAIQERESVHPQRVRSDDSVFVRRGSSEGRGTFLAEVQASPGRCSDSEVSTCWLVRHGRARRRPWSSALFPGTDHRAGLRPSPAGRLKRAAPGHPASARVPPRDDRKAE